MLFSILKGQQPRNLMNNLSWNLPKYKNTTATSNWLQPNLKAPSSNDFFYEAYQQKIQTYIPC